MQLSTRARYAIIALADLARETEGKGSEKPVSLGDIASRQGISLAYLEQIFLRLRRAGLVRSARGAGGGYLLIDAAASVSIARIIRAVDGAAESDAYCLREVALISPDDPTAALWQALCAQIHAFFEAVTLADVIGGRLASLPPLRPPAKGDREAA